MGPHWFDLSRMALYSPVVMVQVDEDPGHHTSDFYSSNHFLFLHYAMFLYSSRVIFIKINLHVDYCICEAIGDYIILDIFTFANELLKMPIFYGPSYFFFLWVWFGFINY